MIKCKKDKNDLRQMLQKKAKNILCYGECSCLSTLESSVFMGKNYSGNWHSIKNSKDLTMKQMFDISAKLVSGQDTIYGVNTIDWEDYSWQYLSLVMKKSFISLQRTKVDVFSDSVLCLGETHETPNQTLLGNKDWNGSKHLRNTETLTESTASQWNSSGIFFQDSKRCSSVKKSNIYC